MAIDAAQHVGVQGGAFAERLKLAMDRNGWSLSETARQAAKVLGPDAKFGRAHVWHYLNGRALPRRAQLHALSQALGLTEDELLGSAPTSARANQQRPASLRVEDLGGGHALLQVSQRVRWDTALRVLRALEADREH
jgi:transcriptional regulator with XRE-family HTH domain